MGSWFVPVAARRVVVALTTCLACVTAGCGGGGGPPPVAAPTPAPTPVLPANPYQDGPAGPVEGTVRWIATTGHVGCPTLTTRAGQFTLVGPIAEDLEHRARAGTVPVDEHVLLDAKVLHKQATVCQAYRQLFVTDIKKVMGTPT